MPFIDCGGEIGRQRTRERAMEREATRKKKQLRDRERERDKRGKPRERRSEMQAFAALVRAWVRGIVFWEWKGSFEAVVWSGPGHTNGCSPKKVKPTAGRMFAQTSFLAGRCVPRNACGILDRIDLFLFNLTELLS